MPSRQVRLVLRHLRGGRRRHLETLFRVVNEYLGGIEVDYFLAFGTLLGYYREGRLLAHDQDVDFGLPEACYPLVWGQRHRLPEGFRMWDTSHRHGGPKLYVGHRGWEADLYFYADQGGSLRAHLNSEFPPDTQPFPRELVFPTRVVPMLGGSTRIPAQPEAWLRHVYGYLGEGAVRDSRTGYFRPRTRVDRLVGLAPLAAVAGLGLWWLQRRHTLSSLES